MRLNCGSNNFWVCTPVTWRWLSRGALVVVPGATLWLGYKQYHREAMKPTTQRVRKALQRAHVTVPAPHHGPHVPRPALENTLRAWLDEWPSGFTCLLAGPRGVGKTTR